MFRRLFRLIAVLLLWVACAAPALAQGEGRGTSQPGRHQQQSKDEEDAAEPSVTHAPAYAVAILSSVLVLLIVCKPSRKT